MKIRNLVRVKVLIAQKLAARYSGLKDTKMSSLTTSDSRKVSHFHKNLKQAPGKKLQELQHQCLVQLSTLPVAVCYGTGASVKEAQSAAAHNALEYLMIMTKK
ncbi:Interferon-inducible double-stranded RNA-dependent protein kinase activator A [Portunus trituberculatus]|uniref:Interferon-inducible double-stranded RNA-dependent protein kinase activator A n=1 Tax=Portunus trituberculatus TaxID=210409 RepID=A0A5B7DD95_PORTR|nr:Interferon-inducible double-stranded RNA-dependent protein kinase activator A [Portunus trituberculatus]